MVTANPRRAITFQGLVATARPRPAAAQQLLSGADDRGLRLWDASAGRHLEALEEHVDAIGCVAVSPRGQWAASGSYVNSARLFRLPAAQATLNDLDWAQDALGDGAVSEPERAALAFVKELLRWRRRYDIGLEEKAPISVGEFDIEIEG